MKKSVCYVLAILSMIFVSSCAHVECAKIEKVSGVKTESPKSIYDAPVVMGKDLPPDKGVLFMGGPFNFFIENYYPRKCKVGENAWEDINILPAETVEITFSPKSLMRWKISLKNENEEIFRECFDGTFMVAEDKAPQIFRFKAIKEVCDKKELIWNKKEGESLKILITNDSDILLQVSVATQTAEKKLAQ